MIHRVARPSRPEYRPGALGVRAVLFALALMPWATSCTPVATTSGAPEPTGTPIPAIEDEGLPAPMAAEARRLLTEARRHLASGDHEAARNASRDIILLYPGALGSGEALDILARASLALGQAEEAVDASTRFLDLIGPDHPGFPGAVVLNSRARAVGGDAGGALRALFRVPAALPPEDLSEGAAFVRELVREVEAEELRTIAEDAPTPHPFRGIAATELAVTLFLEGDTTEAEEWARIALLEDLSDVDRDLSRGVLAGDMGDLLGEAVTLGAILPRTGVSPGLAEYSELVLEGIQVAVEQYQSQLRRPIRLEVLDHEGAFERSRSLVRELEDLGAFAAVGPLTLEFLEEAVSARTRDFPMVSPFSSITPEGAEGVFTLSGPDPGGSEVVARYAWDLGLERVMVLRPRTETARVDAEAFSTVFQELGGYLPPEVVFESGATFFQAELERVGSILPDGLFLPLTARDIQLLAPQFTYYGLDTLGIQVLGTTGWTEDAVLAEVDSRHTDGVIASTTRISQDETESYQAFRVRYEDRFKKSLRSVVPAYGYDAASLLLHALGADPRTNEDLLRVLDDVEDFPGATGHFSLTGEQILRIPQLVRIQDRELIYITPHYH